MKYILLAVLSLAASGAPADCVLEWDSTPDYVDGIRFFQGGDGVSPQVGFVLLPGPSRATSAPCTSTGVDPGAAGDITAAFYRGDDESPRSDPARYIFPKPTVRLEVTVVVEVTDVTVLTP
jgi:hypothetical protein